MQQVDTSPSKVMLKLIRDSNMHKSPSLHSLSNKPISPSPPRPQPKLSNMNTHPYLNPFQTPPPPQPMQLQIKTSKPTPPPPPPPLPPPLPPQTKLPLSPAVKYSSPQLRSPNSSPVCLSSSSDPSCANAILSPNTECTNGHSPTPSSELQNGLPSKFTAALRQLFDVFDDTHCGFVQLEELRTRFESTSANDRPEQLLECLTQVADTQGRVSFDSFCAGVKICLLKSQVSKSLQASKDTKAKRKAIANSSFDSSISLASQVGLPAFPPSLSVDRSRLSQTPRSVSVPADRLRIAESRPSPLAHFNNNHLSQTSVQYLPPPPPNIPIYAQLRSTSARRVAAGSSDDLLGNERKNQIIHRLYDWRAGVMRRGRSVEGRLEATSVDTPDGMTNGQTNEPMYSVIEKKVPHKRREARRHTVTNPSDLQSIKKVHQLEQDKEILYQGAEMVEKARVWFATQIKLIDAKLQGEKERGVALIDWAGLSFSEQKNTEPKTLNSFATRILNINCQLRSLIESNVNEVCN